MNPKVYLFLAIASLAGIAVSFVFLILRLASEQFYETESTVIDIMLTIFMFMGLVVLFVFLGIYFLIKYAKANDRSAYEELTKKCISCGTTIGLTELSCPRCFTLQPPGGRSPSMFRKK